MLTRNCAINKLLREGDFNVRVTVYDPAKASNDLNKQKSAWLEAIRDSLGGGIANTSQQCEMYIQNENGCEIGSGLTAGKNIIKVIDAICDAPQPLRINIKSDNSFADIVWIIA